MTFIYRCPVPSSWLDINGHMNVVAYFEVFFDAYTLACRDPGLGPAYLAQGQSLFASDLHITYVREIRAGATLTVKTRIVDCDAKRFVRHQEMVDDRDGALAATAEHVQLNVGVASRKVEPFRKAADGTAGSRRKHGAESVVLQASTPGRRLGERSKHSFLNSVSGQSQPYQ
ncbi:acyl-CoA thioester hydrolase [Bradyrhizobium sp. GM2.4]